MHMFLLNMFFYILIGIIPALAIDLIVVEGRNKMITIFMILLGSLSGWISFIAYAFITGGLETNILFMTLPTIIVSFLSIWLLIKFAKVKVLFSRPHWRVGKYSSLSAFVMLFVVFFLIGLTVLTPFTLDSVSVASSNSMIYDGNARLPTGYLTVTDSMENSAVGIQNSKIVSSIESDVVSVSFPYIAENPTEGQYLNFRVTFTAGSGGGDWSEPYVKIWVFADLNLNGLPDTGEPLVNHINYKFPTNNVMWLNHILWTNGGISPKQQINILQTGSDVLVLPIFRSSITVWKNDKGETVGNTPEGYVLPWDEISWEEQMDGSFVMKEGITGWSIIPAGGTAPAIEGKIYCLEGTAARHGIVYQAFDARYSDPYDMSATPLAQKIDLFDVIPPGDGGDDGSEPDITITSSTWITGVALVTLTSIGFAATWKIGSKMLKK